MTLMQVDFGRLKDGSRSTFRIEKDGPLFASQKAPFGHSFIRDGHFLLIQIYVCIFWDIV